MDDEHHGPSVERLILDRLLDGSMTQDFARDLMRQADLWNLRAEEYRRAFPGKALAMVADKLVMADGWDQLMAQLEAEFPDRPFYVGETGAVRPVV